MLAEAIGDVPVDEVQLTKRLYELLYRRSIDSVVKSCSSGAPREFLRLLIARSPVALRAEDADESVDDPSVLSWVR